LKLIRSSSHFSALQCIRDSSLCSCHFGHENIKKINPGLSRVWPGRPGPGSTLRVDRILPSQFPAFFLLRPGPATGPGRPGPELTRRAGSGLKTLNQSKFDIYNSMMMMMMMMIMMKRSELFLPINSAN
jgi:hypothetical protein